MARTRETADYTKALQKIFVIYWQEELREAVEGVKQEGEKPVPPMDKRLRRMYGWMESRTRQVVLFMGKACAVLLCAFVLLLAVNKDVRAWALGFVKEIYDEYINFSSTSPVPEGEVELVRHELGYVPEGYELFMDEIDGSSGFIVYATATGNMITLRYEINKVESYVNADSTDMIWQELVLNNGVIAEYGENLLADEKRNYLIWVKEGFIYELICEESKEEMCKIAEGVHITEE